jgi:hypothetical protein
LINLGVVLYISLSPISGAEGETLKKIGLLILLATVGGVASASPPNYICKTEYFWGVIPYEVCKVAKPSPALRAPEIDPASAAAGVTLLIGGLAVLRSRRSKIARA